MHIYTQAQVTGSFFEWKLIIFVQIQVPAWKARWRVWQCPLHLSFCKSQTSTPPGRPTMHLMPKALIRYQALSHDRGTKHTVTMGTDRLWLHRQTLSLCLIRTAHAEFLSEITDCPTETSKSVCPTTVSVPKFRNTHIKTFRHASNDRY